MSVESIKESIAKDLSYWSTANGDDTMITVWNPADEAQDFLLTFNFEFGHYRLPVHLGPRATQTLNISDLIKSNLPDVQGNTIPASVTEGSATLSGSQAENQEILAALDAGTYNVNKAICRYYCISCDGTIHVYVAANPFAVAQGGQTSLVLMAQQHSGGTYSIGASWSSNHTNIATVSSSSGLVTGVSLGAVTMTANATHTPWYNSYYCAYDPFCPYYGSGSGQGSGNVTPTVTIDSFSPDPIALNATANVHITVNPSNTISLSINSIGGGTGRATFGTGGGNTTTTIPETTTVNVHGDTGSQAGGADLTLTASYLGTNLATAFFSVTSGTCTAAYTTHGGDGVKLCPAQNILVYDRYTINNYCGSCSVSCFPSNFDSSFTPDSEFPCRLTNGGTPGQTNPTFTSTVNGTFAPTDCSLHHLQARTRIVDAQGGTTDYLGASFDLSCNANGSPACQ